MQKLVVTLFVAVLGLACSEKLTPRRARSLAEESVRRRAGTDVRLPYKSFESALKVPIFQNYAAEGAHSDNPTPEQSVVIGLTRTGILVASAAEKLRIVDATGEYERTEGSADECRCRLSVRHEAAPTALKGKLVCVGGETWIPMETRMVDCTIDRPIRGWVNHHTGTTVIIDDDQWYAFHSRDEGLMPQRANWATGNAWPLVGAFRRLTPNLRSMEIVRYDYRVSDEGKRLGIVPTGGEAVMGELKIDRVTDLILASETAANGIVHYHIEYNPKLKVLLDKGLPQAGTAPIRFAQTPERKWVVIDSGTM